MIETIYMFAGSDGAMAYSIDESGAHLPQQYAPWVFQRPVSTRGPTFKAGADKSSLKEVEGSGFAVTIFSVTFEPPLPRGP